jgi:predicted branched-subunit amino acid permease
LRFVIYSAQWHKYFGHLPRLQRLVLGYFAVDLSFVLFSRRFPDAKPAPEQLPYFWGGAVWGWTSWQGASLVGIVLADRIPTEWGIGFAGVLALLGLTYSLLRGARTWLAASAAASAAVAAFGLPLKLNIVVGIAAGVIVGMLADRLLPNVAVERA